jgi:hypothetical protein
MEIVLLWLDDLDDLVFSGVLLWESLRRLALQVGLVAALALAVCELTAFGLTWSSMLALVAAASVAVWIGGTLCQLAQRPESAPSIA